METYCPTHSFSLHFNMRFQFQKKKKNHRNTTRSDTLLNSPKIFFLSVHASLRQGPSFHHRKQKHLLCSLPLCPGNSLFSTFSPCHSDTIPLIFRIGIIIITVRESDERERESIHCNHTLRCIIHSSPPREKRRKQTQEKPDIIGEDIMRTFFTQFSPARGKRIVFLYRLDRQASTTRERVGLCLSVELFH